MAAIGVFAQDECFSLVFSLRLSFVSIFCCFEHLNVLLK